jgi:transketolase
MTMAGEDAARAGDVQGADVEVRDFIARGAAGPIPRLYGEALVAAARRDPRIVCLCADLPGSTETDLFREVLPKRHVEAGIAEANMIGMAAGMARAGDVPFVHSFCVFVTRRCYDQVANQVAYPRLPVKIVGFLPGLTTVLGVSHQAIDDVALMRALPNMTIIEPAGPEQLGAAVEAALAVDGPVYLRMKRPDGPVPDLRPRPIAPGIELLRDGPDGALVAAGLLVPEALAAAEQLAAEGIAVAVAAVARLKPLDTAGLVALGRRVPTVVTCENHSIIGGLGAAVAETFLENRVAVGFSRVGVRDTFAEGGTTPYLQARYGLTARDIVAAFRHASARAG